MDDEARRKRAILNGRRDALVMFADLHGPPKAILLALRMCERRWRQVRPSQPFMAMLAGVSERSARRGVDELKAAGIIEVTGSTGRRNTYRINYDALRRLQSELANPGQSDRGTLFNGEEEAGPCEGGQTGQEPRPEGPRTPATVASKNPQGRDQRSGGGLRPRPRPVDPDADALAALATWPPEKIAPYLERVRSRRPQLSAILDKAPSAKGSLRLALREMTPLERQEITDASPAGSPGVDGL